MHILLSVFIALGLAMDAFAVSLAAGMRLKKVKPRHALTLGGAFGLFQFIMPLIGWYLGANLSGYISAVDHWVAFILLSYIGGKMIYESTHKGCVLDTNPFLLKNLLLLSIATSIDALSVGFSLALVNTPILLPAILIGAVTFAFSYAGTYIGNKTGCYIGKKAGLAGGAVLVGIGIKILIEHLFF